MSADTPRSIRVEKTMSGTPEQVWAMVADVTRMGSWSPESDGWLYEFAAVEGGCRVTESWEDHRGLLASKLAPLATGVKDRPARNRETMEATLEQLAAATRQA